MKNKGIDHISKIFSKRRRIFNIFFQMQGKLETCLSLNLINSRRPSFGDDVNVTFIS